MWLLWSFLAFRGCTGFAQARPERSLLGTWESVDMRIECRANGSVASGGATSKLVTWHGSRLVFISPALAATLRDYGAGSTRWDFVLGRQCGLVQHGDQNDLAGPHVNRKQLGDTIEATVRWSGEEHFVLGGIDYYKCQEKDQ